MIALPTAFLVGLATSTDAESTVRTQLDALGYDVVDAPLDGHALALAVRAAAGARIALVDRRFVGHTHALRQAILDPRYDALAGPGAISVARTHRAELAAAIEAAESNPLPTLSGDAEQSSVRSSTTQPENTRPDNDRAGGTRQGDTHGSADLTQVQIRLEQRTSVHHVDPAPLVAGIAAGHSDAEALRARMQAVDEEKVRLRQAVKSDDTFFTAMTVRRYSGQAARWLAGLGITPNLVTVFSLAVALVSAGLTATGNRWGYLGAAVLFHIAFALDCIDGDLARYTLNFSRLGAWLDATFDRVKEYVLFAGLAIGAIRSDGDLAIWALAGAAMALQTVRHQMHFGYEEMASGPGGSPPLAAEVQARLDGNRWKVWLRRAAVLPQGERSALICLLVAFTNPWITFVVLLVTGALAGLYGTIGRLLRSLRRLHQGWSKRAAKAIGAMVDIGPVGWILHYALPGRSLPAPVTTLIALVIVGVILLAIPTVGPWWLPVAAIWYALLAGFASRQPLNGWADWVLPPSFRAAEYAVVLVPTLMLYPEALPATFAFIAATAFHHYDTVYRLRGAGTEPPRWLLVATGGHDGRIIALSLLGAAGSTAWSVGLVVISIYLAVVLVAESVMNTVAWVRQPRSDTSDRPEPLRASDEQAADA